VDVLDLSFSSDDKKHPLFSKNKVIFVNSFSCAGRSSLDVFKSLHALHISSLQVCSAVVPVTIMQVVDESRVNLPKDVLELLVLGQNKQCFTFGSTLFILCDHLIIR
jgi:hypothetical protein